MRRVVPLLIVLCLGFAPAPVYRERLDPNAVALKALQGGWRLVSFRAGEKFIQLKDDSTITIIHQRITDGGTRKPDTGWDYTIDARVQPGRFDRKLAVGENASMGIYMRGIYKIEGDTLTLCSSDRDRPVDFTAEKRNLYVEVYTRIKP